MTDSALPHDDDLVRAMFAATNDYNLGEYVAAQVEEHLLGRAGSTTVTALRPCLPHLSALIERACPTAAWTIAKGEFKLGYGLMIAPGDIIIIAANPRGAVLGGYGGKLHASNPKFKRIPRNLRWSIISQTIDRANACPESPLAEQAQLLEAVAHQFSPGTLAELNKQNARLKTSASWIARAIIVLAEYDQRTTLTCGGLMMLPLPLIPPAEMAADARTNAEIEA
jgi:hypothetical protein